MTGNIIKFEDMIFNDLTDLQMAFKVRMLMRNDLEHEATCCAARDRIMYLSQQLAEATNEILSYQRIVSSIKGISELTCSLVS